MFYIFSIMSYFIYSLLVIVLFVTSLISSVSSGHLVISLLKITIIGFLFYEIFIEWSVYLYPKKTSLKSKKLSKEDLYMFISVFLGTLFSYLLNHNFSLGAVVASSLVGIIGGLLAPKMGVPIYCGTFSGMVSSLLVSDIKSVIAVGLLSAFMFVIGEGTFKGFGGKLGATAYFGTLLTSLIFKTFSNTMTGESIDLQLNVFAFFIIGSLATYFINQVYKIGPVIASGLLGITFGLILPNVFSNGSSLAVALFCGTFIGMSTTSKLTTRVSVLLASLIAAIIYLYTSPYFAGLGGKLGLIAFGSTIATAGIYNFKAHGFPLKNKKP